MDEGRKRVLLIAASILAARKLAQYDSGARVPATVSAIADSIRWAERIMEEIDRQSLCEGLDHHIAQGNLHGFRTLPTKE